MPPLGERNSEILMGGQLLCTARHLDALSVERMLAVRTVDCDLKFTVVATENFGHIEKPKKRTMLRNKKQIALRSRKTAADK